MASSSIHLTSRIVCTGKAKPTEAEFKSLASVLGISDNVSLKLVYIVQELVHIKRRHRCRLLTLGSMLQHKYPILSSCS